LACPVGAHADLETVRELGNIDCAGVEGKLGAILEGQGRSQKPVTDGSQPGAVILISGNIGARAA